MYLGLQQLGQPRNEQRHPASFIPGQILGHHWHLPVVLAVDIGDEVLVAVVDPIAPGVSVTCHGAVIVRGGFGSLGGGVLDVVIGDLIVGLEMFEVCDGLITLPEARRMAAAKKRTTTTTTKAENPVRRLPEIGPQGMVAVRAVCATTRP